MNVSPFRSPNITLPGKTRAVRAFGDEVYFLLTGEHTGGMLTTFTDITPPGGGPPPHTHDYDDEWWHVLEGRVSFFNGKGWHEVPPGGAVFMPKSSVHTFKNIGDKPSRMIVSTSPSGFETFFTRCAEEFAKPGGPDMKRIVAISAEHGIHYV